MALQRPVIKLVEDAKSRIKEYSVAQAMTLIEDPQQAENVQLIDIRDIRELMREGMIPNSFHCPRGMAEFWIDPDSPYYKPIFGEDREFVFYCGGGWRSALTADTVQSMGLSRVAHIIDGFAGWKKAGGTIIPYNKQLAL